ncbi:hypothetical protein BH09MYX1_BH09MYX1_42750 [soil metagenome]
MGYLKFAFGLGLVAIACGDSTTSTPAVTADQACTDTYTALCAKLDGCATLLIQTQYGDQPSCVARAKLACASSFAAPGTSKTPTTLEACGKAIPATSCTDITANAPPDACRAKPGTVANGGACAGDAQCVSTACIDTGTTGCGTCGPRIAAGGACGKAGQGPCDYGTSCLSSICKKLGAAGEACTATADCGFELACKSNTCAIPDAAGETCVSGDDTCDRVKGFFCHPTKKQCIAYKLAAINAACGFDAGGDYSVCIGGAYCKTGAQPLSGVCTKLVADGAACDDKNPCQAPAQCNSGLCKIVDPASCK